MFRAANTEPMLLAELERAAVEGPRPSAFKELFNALYAATGQRVALLIDEYDAPLLHAWTAGYYDQVADWFRVFLTAGLKDNSLLLRGVLTGILRVAKWIHCCINTVAMLRRRRSAAGTMAITSATARSTTPGLSSMCSTSHCVGRADVQLIPKRSGLPGVVLEFKRKSDRHTLVYHAGAALRQISAKGYCAELEAAGATPIHRLGISFSGKEIVVRGATGGPQG